MSSTFHHHYSWSLHLKHYRTTASTLYAFLIWLPEVILSQSKMQTLGIGPTKSSIRSSQRHPGSRRSSGRVKSMRPVALEVWEMPCLVTTLVSFSLSSLKLNRCVRTAPVYPHIPSAPQFIRSYLSLSCHNALSYLLLLPYNRLYILTS
jgi:hypothetical protein